MGLLYNDLHGINTLARVVLQASWSDSTSGLLQELHWLTIRQCAHFKIIAVTYKTNTQWGYSLLQFVRTKVFV